MVSDKPQPMKLGTTEVLQRIKDVVRDIVTPSWLNSVPSNFGDAAAGTLKADEWRTLCTIHIPLALISLWGMGVTHPSPDTAGHLRRVLDHSMALFSAISLVCRRTMTRTRAEAYRTCLATWVTELNILYPTLSVDRPNIHMAFHIFDFLHLFGPVHSWWSFPFERLVGILQRLPINHKSGT